MRWLRRWADASLVEDIKRLEHQLEVSKIRESCLQATITAQAEVIARDRQRVAAETAAYALKIAQAEQGAEVS
jgi:hypothetical protein